MERLRRYAVEGLMIASFLVLPLLLYGGVTLGGRTMLPVDNLFQWAPWAAHAAELGVETPQNSLISDLIIQNYAWKQFIRQSVAAGELPLWNPDLFAGAPFLAAGQHGAYYPFSLLFLILPLAQAYGWYTVSQLWLAGALMYVYGRILNMRRGSALLAGLVYQGGGYIVISAAVFPMIIGAVAWLPLLLACVEKICNAYCVLRNGSNGDRSRQGPGTVVLWVGLGAMALGTQILAGHIEFTIYTLLVMALYAAWRLLHGQRTTNHDLRTTPDNLRATPDDLRTTPDDLRTTLIRPFLALTAMVALGLMLGAVQLVPLYELGQVNFRQEASSFDEVLDFAFPPRRVLTLALPNFFGNPAHHSYRDAFSGETVPLIHNYDGQPKTNTEWGLKNYVEGGVYLGILPLFLALLSLRGLKRPTANRRRWSHTLFYLLLALLSLAFIFGTPLYAILYYGLPFVNQLHTPFRWVFPLTLAVAVLAGFGVDLLLEIRDWRLNRSPISNLQSPISLVSGLAFLGGGLLLVGLGLSWLFYGRLEPLIERLFLGLALASQAFPGVRAFYSYQFWQLLTLGLLLLGVGLVLWWARRGRKRPYWLAAALLLLVADLFLAHRGFHASNDPALLAFEPEAAAWLAAQPGHWRLTTYTPQADKPFNANTPWLYGLEDVRGYDSMIPRQYTDYMAAIEPQNELKFNRIQPIAHWQSLNSPLLDVLGVRYVVTTDTIDLPKFTLAWEGEGVRIYENAAVAPRAYTLPQTATAVVDDPLQAMTTRYDPRQYAVVEIGDWRLAGEPISNLQSPISRAYTLAEIKNYSNIEVTVDTAVSEPSWLILNDSYFPGWKAYVRPVDSSEDEEQVDIIRVNHNFRGVLLEPGAWTVRFRYSPISFQLGGLISFMGGIILLFAGAVWGWRRFYNPDGVLSTTRSVAKNSLAPIALNLFNKLIDFGYAAFYLRVLGPTSFGSFQTAIITAGIFDIVSNFGLDILLIRDVSGQRERAPNYLLNTTILRLGAAVVASLPVAAIIGITNLWDRANSLTGAEITATVLIMAGMVFSGMSKGVTGLFYVHEEAEVPNAMTTVTTILKVGLGAAALLLGFGFVGLAAVSIVTNVITLAILLLLAVRRYTLTGPWQVDWDLQRRMVQAGFPLMLIHLLQTVFISIDTYLLRVMLPNGKAVAGWYGSAYKWFNALQIVPSFFTLALFPIISREIKKSIASARQMYGMSLKLMFLLALPIAAVTHFLAVPLVQIVAGDEYLPAGAVALQLVIWSIPIGWLNSVTNYVLISLGMESQQPRAFTVAVVFNIVANLLFIPAFTYRAAAVTTILSEVVLLVMFEYYLRQRMPGVHWLRFTWRPALVTAVMFAAMQLGGQFHMAIGLALGIIIYPAGLFLLRVIGDAEKKVLGSILPAPLAARLRLVENVQGGEPL